jgi:hypothetical protein
MVFKDQNQIADPPPRIGRSIVLLLASFKAKMFSKEDLGCLEGGGVFQPFPNLALAGGEATIVESPELVKVSASTRLP